MHNTIVNDIDIVGDFAIVDSKTGKIICSNSDDYCPEIAIREVNYVTASGDELIVYVY